MDVITFLKSVNKLSLLAFLITLGGLVYEIHQLKKDQRYRSKPKIPKFNQSASVQLPQEVTIVSDKQEKVMRSNNFTIIVILFILLIVFGLAAFFGFSKFSQNPVGSAKEPAPLINFVTSRGIKIFDSQFNPISDTDLSAVKPGEEIIIGVETIKDIDIDRARIRVNKDSWQTEDITVNFNPEKQVFYIKYMVASDESKLKIEAQLHSATEGWLGD